VLDLNTGLTQVLADGTNTYTYGLGRISQTDTSTEYFLADALGSVRQLVNANTDITLTKSYDPYGNVTRSAGSGTSPFAYTGEQQDESTGLTYLRARYYASETGRFVSRDMWGGDESQPITYNKWTYANANPIIYTDPTGYIAIVKYDRNAAINYAVKYAVNGNSEYRRFESDCTNFVSQSLQAGGLIQEKDWVYNKRGRTAWMLTDDFFGYFVGTMGFSYTIISGSILPKQDPGDSTHPERYSAQKSYPNNLVIPNPLQMENYGNFSFSSYGIREGDVVLYHQLHSGHVEGGGLFNHAAFILNPNVQLTDRYNGKFLNHSAPYIAEHSGGYEMNNGGPRATNNIHSINDTWSEVQAMIVIHIPDAVIYPDLDPYCTEGG
jgi:RHS repeat-associated protein